LYNSHIVPALKPFAVVALLEDIPAERLERGQVGTILEELAPNVYEVEFSDTNGRTYATAALRGEQLMQLRYERTTQAA
jgi:hypothetical protein